MKRFKQAIEVAFFVLAANCLLLAQESIAVDKTDDQTPCFISKISGSETKWYRHELGILSICIPETMVRKQKKCLDNGCVNFENDVLFFSADLNTAAWRPTFEKKYPSYSEKQKVIDAKPSTIWFFEDTGKYKYVAGINIVLERGRIGMGAYLFSKSPDSKPIADRMFNSIQFIKSDPK